MPSTLTAMKAIRIHAQGGPEVLAYEDAPIPEPAANEVLVRIHAAAVNPVDWKIREGHLGTIMLPSTMGSDFAGVIEAVGAECKNFDIGDAVFGTVADESGSYAEYAVATEPQIARKPEGLDFLLAAALPIASMTAWQALFDIAKIQSGQTVLIHAAGGGVGSFAVQFAKMKDIRVIATSSEESAGYVRELGADQVIDYRKTKFDETVRDVDMVFDTIGKDTQDRSWKVLKKGGILVSIVQPIPPGKAEANGVRGIFFRCDHNRGDQLAEIGELVADGKIKVNVETVLPLEEARQAQELSQRGHTHGKIVLRVD